MFCTIFNNTYRNTFISKNTAKQVNGRPIPIVFSIIWPIICIMLSLSWYFFYKENKSNNVNIIYQIKYQNIIMFIMLILLTLFSFRLFCKT
jgi:tryptophan-rich sensory protein